MSYTPPVGDAVILDLTGVYTPPVGDAVILDLTGLAGSSFCTVVMSTA